MKELKKEESNKVNAGIYDDNTPEYGLSAEDIVKNAVIPVIFSCYPK